MGLIVSFFSAVFEKLGLFPQKVKKSKYEVDDGVTLFDTGLSPPARRVRITLLEKQIPFKKVDINLLAGEQYNKEYCFVNPNKKVPAVAFKNFKGIPDGFYFESNVICELLDTVSTGAKLYPTDKKEKAQIRMWQDYELGIVDDFVPLAYYNLISFVCRTMHADSNEMKESMDKNTPEAAKERFAGVYNAVGKTEKDLYEHAIASYQNLLTLERGLSGKQYLVGDRFTAADISVFPRIHMFSLVGMPIPQEHFPNVYAWIQRIYSRPSVSSSEDFPTKITRFVITSLTSIFVLIGNVKSGQKHHKRIDGTKVIDKAVNEAPVVTEFKLPQEALDNPKVVVDDYPVSSDCLQIKLLLQELNVKYDTRNCHILNMIGRAAGSGGIFTIYHNNQPIKGMRGITEYICSLGAKIDLLPSDPSVKGKIQSWQAWEQTMYIQELYPLIEVDIYSRILVHRYEQKLDDLLNLRSQPEYQTKFTCILKCFMAGLSKDSDCLEKLKEEYGHLIEEPEALKKRREGFYELLHGRLQHLDNTLMHQDYLVGKDVTMADICVFSRLMFFSYVGMKISTQKYSNLSTWILKMQSQQNVAYLLDDINKQITSLSQ
ncbi:hypothetical protein SNE40_016968 [Patella caerulea]|uniref:Glutathione transferase n=1 Tax=Patella caerulea TaxID=87958 RepID=A0AAN8J9J2_PATCE